MSDNPQNSGTPTPSGVPSPKSARWKQWKIVGWAVVVIVAVVAVTVSTTNPPKKDDKRAAEVRKNFATPKVSDKEVWIAQTEKQMREKDEKISKLESGMKQLMDRMSNTSGAGAAAGLPPPPPLPFTVGGPQKPGANVPPGMPAALAGNTPGPAGSKGAHAPDFGKIIKISIPDKGAGSKTKALDGKNKERSIDTYVPAGSFVSATLLGGVDAPTGGQSQGDPTPILLELTDNAFLPNQYRTQVRKCFAIAAANGDISSERVHGRIETVSCVRRDKSIMEARAKGYVAGEDGKAGMRGTLVERAGSKLAKSLLAGVLAGLGTGLAQSYTTLSTSALGSVSTAGNSTAEILKYGAATGTGKALDRLAQYYISQAEKIYPIIEVNAGRTVQIVFTQGFSIDSAGSVDDNFSLATRPIITNEEKRLASQLEIKPR